MRIRASPSHQWDAPVSPVQPLNPVVAVVDDVAAGTQAAAVGLLL